MPKKKISIPIEKPTAEETAYWEGYQEGIVKGERDSAEWMLNIIRIALEKEYSNPTWTLVAVAGFARQRIEDLKESVPEMPIDDARPEDGWTPLCPHCYNALGSNPACSICVSVGGQIEVQQAEEM